MKQAGMISKSMISKSKLSLLIASVILGTSALMYAQEQREDPKPNETSRPAASKDEKSRPAQDDKRATPQDSRDQSAKAPEQNEDKAVRGEDRSTHQQDNNSRMEQRTDRNAQSDRQTTNRDSRSDRGTTQAQGQGNDHRSGGRIPEAQFRSHFGRQHTFAVSRPVVVGGQPQFQYGGYTFNIIGAWPADWAYTDEYYVDYINDDYLLFDLAHPGVSVAIVVVM